MKKEIYVHTGKLYATKAPLVLRTILGSCVAVCLFDPVGRIGGMSHIFLPGTADRKSFDDSTCYGVNAMELLINRIMNLGGDRYQLKAKIFGGAHILQGISKKNGTGRKNIKFVLEFLKAEGIKIISQDLGGHDTRRIHFHTDTGDVFLKRIRFMQYQKIAIEEQKYLKRIKRELKKPAEVTLF